MQNIKKTNLTRRAASFEEVQPQQSRSNGPFYLLLFYLLLEFGRPQDMVPGLGVLRLSMLTSIVIAFQLFFSGKVEFSKEQTKLFFPLLGLMVIHGPIAVNNFEAFMKFEVTSLYFVCYLGIITFVDSFRKIQILTTVWLGIHLIVSIVGIMKGGVGVGGWLGDENDLCMELTMVISFAFFGIMLHPKKIKKSVYGGLLVCFLMTIIATGSRGGFLGMSAVGSFCWAKSSRKVLSAILVFVLVGFIIIVAPDKYWNEIASIGSDKEVETGTGGERLYTWGIAWEMFLANPIIGVGQGNFPWAFAEYEGDRTFLGHSVAGRMAHSMYFTLLPELGLVGTCIFLGMLYYTWRDLKIIRKSYRETAGVDPQKNEEAKTAYFLGLAMEGSLLGYLTSSIFISTLYYPSFWIMMGFVVALRNAMIRNGIKDLDPAHISTHIPTRNLHLRFPSSRAGSQP